MTPAENLTVRLNGRWHGSYGTCRCPAHDDHQPSLSVRDGDRSVLLKCHAGCEVRSILAALRRDGYRLEIIGPVPPKSKPRRTAEDTRRYLLSIWRHCLLISEAQAERYLRGRGIDRDGQPRADVNGKPIYSQLIEFRDRATGDRFSAMVISLLEAVHPDTLTDGRAQ